MTKTPNLDSLLSSDDVNASIIELDNFIGELCDYGDDYNNLTEQQRLFYLNQNLEREINNGGFEQYFRNSSGDNAHETILSLKAIGAYKTADILQQAIDQFPNKQVSKVREERIKSIEQIEEVVNEVWNKLGQKFFKYEDDLNALNIAYVKKYKDFF
ncbi:MAG TPA: DMP19 family protein [Chitinophagaceae bacterium]|jgi:hypothetical protein|nr:DMP19 family protein [Chitinophagaceae bacterium]